MMADDAPDDEALEADVQDDETIPLDEWCQGQSRSDNRVELMAVFVHRERAAGRNHDTPSAYAARFAAIHNSPTSA
jgi:hypothetical protein